MVAGKTISARKLAANRANARRSTGPRTPEGKRRSRANALKHGLSVSVLADPRLAAEVEVLARRIADGYQRLLDRARGAAEVRSTSARGGASFWQNEPTKGATVE
jgi:hypothetical protein